MALISDLINELIFLSHIFFNKKKGGLEKENALPTV
jgi:hypothetical protein